MVNCKQIPADVAILSDVGLANAVTLLAGTSLAQTDVGLAGVLALVAAGHGIANADCGTTSGGATSGGATSGTPCGTHHR